jgi:hypothetical protein
MAGLADLLYLGQPDPARQLAMALAGRQQPQPPQGGPPPGPGPAGPGPGPAPNAPAPNAQPVNADPNAPAPNPAPGAPPPPGSPPQPTALQSTPDMSASYQTLANPPNLMSLYIQLQQRQQASDQINRGLALIAANHSAPSMRQSIMEAMTGGGQDAGSTVNNLMSLYQGQQQMAAQQQMLGNADAMDAKLGLPPGTSRAEILAGRGPDLVKAMEPTEQMRSLQQARTLYKTSHPDATPEEIEAAVPMGLFVGAQGGDALTSSWLKARALVPPAQWPDHPELKDPLTYSLYTQDQKKRQDNVDAAAAAFQPNNTGLMDVRSKITAIQSNPELEHVLQNPLLISAVKAGKEGTLTGAISSGTQAALASATPEQKQLASDILDLTDQDYIKALQGKAPPTDILPMTTAISALGRLNTAPKQYKELLNSALDAVDNARANNYGASGQLDQIPDDDLRQRVGTAYLPGGGAFVGQGKPMPPDEIAAAKDAMQQKPKATVIDLYRRHGYNTKPIE